MSMARTVSLAWLVAAALVGGCATGRVESPSAGSGSAGGDGGEGIVGVDTPRPLAWKSGKDPAGALTAQDLEGSQFHDAYTLVRAMRPDWLRMRGKGSIILYEEVRVYRDGVLYGGPGSLRNILTDQIERIEKLSGIEATAYFGTSNGNGVIAVFTRS
jgi:hypothetical protein